EAATSNAAAASLAARRDMGHLELDPVGILEEHGVVAGGILGEVARSVVQRGESACVEELATEAVHVLPPLDAEGHVIEPGSLPVEARAHLGWLRGHQPEVGGAVRESRHVALRVDDPVLEVAE